MPGGTGLLVRRQHAERSNIVVHFLDKTPGQIIDAFLVLIGAVDDFVIHVGDIAHVGHMLLAEEMAKVAIHHVEHHQHPGMAHMAHVIDRHAADIHADILRIDRLKRGFLPGQVVVDLQHGVRFITELGKGVRVTEIFQGYKTEPAFTSGLLPAG